MLVGRIFCGDRRQAGENGADADPRHAPRRHHLYDAVDIGGHQHTECDDDEPCQDHRFAPDIITYGRKEEGAGHHAEQAGAENHAELGRHQTPFVADLGGGIGDGEDVEAVEHIDRPANADDKNLKARHRAVLDLGANILVHHCCGIAHASCSSLRMR